MGFTKIAKDAARKERKEFVPSTSKELKQMAERARERDETRNADRGSRKENVRSSRFPRGWRDIRLHLLQGKPVKVFRPQFFELLIEYIKENGEKPPAYNLWEKPRDADASFRYDMQCCVARMSWMQCAKLTDVAVGVPIPTRDQSEAWKCLMEVLFSAFDMEEDALDGKSKVRHWVVIKNRDALEEWPIPARKRKSNKEDDAMFADENNRKMRASARDEDDEDDESPRKRGGSDEDDDDEDETPKRKAKAKATKRKAKDEDEDDEPPRRKKKAVKEDDDEDEEDEKPTRGKKKKAAADEDDEDEDEKPTRKRKASKDDDEDDEDEKPARKRRAAKDDEEEDDEKPTRKRRAAKEDVSLKDLTIIAKVGERDKGGKPSKLLALIPKKGITIKELILDAKEEGISAADVKPIILKTLLKYDYVKIKE